MKRLECLDGLRGLLAVYVMASHMAPFASLPVWVLKSLSHGGAAVDMFFILSGLVILRSLESHQFKARPFLIARVARIFPVFLLVFAMSLVVQSIPSALPAMPWVEASGPVRGIWPEGWPNTWLVDIAAHLTMTHGLFPNGLMPDVWVSFLGASWSLSTEWQFYVLVLLFGRAGLRERRLVVAFLLLALAALVWDRMTPDAWRFSRAFLPNKAHYFALGIASAACLDRRSFRFSLSVVAVVLCLCAAQGQMEKILPPLAWVGCLGAQLFPTRFAAMAWLLRTRMALWLGAISFPIYLVNEPVQKLAGILLSDLAGENAMLFTVLWIPTAILTPIGVASLLHRYVEKPGLLWAKQIARGWRAGVQPA